MKGQTPILVLLSTLADSAEPSFLQSPLLVGLVVLGLLVLGLGLYFGLGRRTPAVPPGKEGPTKLSPKEEGATKLPSKALAKSDKIDRALREGLQKTRGGFIARISNLLSGKQVDLKLLEELEEVLLTADIGVGTSQLLFEKVRTKLSAAQLKDEDAVYAALKDECKKLLFVDAPKVDFSSAHPFVLLIVGVNGVGKTTTIGKLAAQQVTASKRVMLAAGDTFRAAAVEQLEEWGRRSGAVVTKGKEKADPSSVIFDAVKRAKAEDMDLLIADTAGRLHNKVELMEELQKVRRVIAKAESTAPHQTWLVLDATNGQNAIAQAKTFKEVMEITGIILTKLDGTAKGGVILGICNELQVPVRYIGIGEKVGDLRPFDADAFVEALFDRTEDGA